MSQAIQQATPGFTPKRLVAVAAAFIAVAATAVVLARLVRMAAAHWGVTIDCPGTWPLSMFTLKFPGAGASLPSLCFSVAILLVFVILVTRFLEQITASRTAVATLGLLLVLSTNLIHGPDYGLVHPQRGDQLQYYADAQRVTNGGEFLRQFNTIQADLGCHARTHPPGAVLFFYALTRTLGSAAAVSLAIAILSVATSAICLYGVLSYEFDRRLCGYVTLLFLLIPSIQIYYCATLDAVVASCFLVVLLFARHPKTLPCIAGTSMGLFCASMLSFGASFLAPLLLGFEIITRRSVRRSVAALSVVAALYGLLYLGAGFNYLHAFRTASALENPGGFFLLSDPASYVTTRLENVADILWFFGPFLLMLSLGGMRIMIRTRVYPKLAALTALAVAILATMFLSGAFRTGETARACLFIYPYLMFPVAACLQQQESSPTDRKVLLGLVFGQTLAMQTFGGYFW